MNQLAKPWVVMDDPLADLDDDDIGLDVSGMPTLGETVVCIDTECCEDWLTLGEEYGVQGVKDGGFLLIEDANLERAWFHRCHFNRTGASWKAGDALVVTGR